MAVVTWVAAALLALMLVIGPQVIAEDESQPTGGSAGAAPYASGGSGGAGGANGEALFVERCGSCHTLSAAGTSGQVGPVLDGTSKTQAEVEAIVREGRGGMPAFGGELSEDEIAAVAAFVASAR